MATRLERLVLLLDTGSTATVRATAAQQIGEIQKQQPQQLYNLLGRVLVHLRSAEWQTRIAAGLAVEAIASNVPQWEPPAPLPGDAYPAHAADAADEWMLTFDTFDVTNVVKNGAPLLSSAGKEFDVDHSHLDPKERIALQKKELRTRLGMGSDHLNNLLEDEDVSTPNASEVAKPKGQQTAQELLEKHRPSIMEEDPNLSGLSARQKASLKRKMRLGKEKGAKVRILEVSATKHKSCSPSDTKSETKAVKIKSDPDADEPEPSPSTNAIVIGSNGKTESAAESSDEWPFEGLCEQLCLDLFSPKWQLRHGAAIGLRGLLKVHGSGAGKLVGLSRKANLGRHRAWLEDVAIRLLCVLALDRFGDYGSDQAVAPVRETAAQSLGVVMQLGEADLCLRMVNEGLLKLLEASGESTGSHTGASAGREKGWQVRHGALVGLKYWMAVRTDLLESVLKVSDTDAAYTGAFAAIINALRDHDDDVRAVASSALLPVCDTVVGILPVQTVYKSIVLTLWNCLEELDDLTSATGSVMDLLAQLMMKREIVRVMKEQSGNALYDFVPRLYPFFRHAIVAVRQAVLRTIGTFVAISSDGSDLGWVTTELLRLVFQNFIIEERTDIVQDTLDLWKKLMRLMGLDARNQRKQSLTEIAIGVLPSWFSLVMTPIGAPLDLRFFYAPSTELSNGKRSRMDDGFNVSPHDKAMAVQDLTVVSREDIIRGRLAGATALGALVYTLQSSGDPNSTAKISELITAYLNSCWAGHRVFCNVMIDEWAAFWEENTLMEGLPASADRAKFVDSSPMVGTLWENMVTALTQADSGVTLFYNELINPLTNVRTECENILAATLECGSKQPVPALPDLPSRPAPRTQTHFGDTFTVLIADHIVDQVIPHLVPRTSPASALEFMDDRVRRAKDVIEGFKETTRKLEVQVLASMASAVVRMSRLPAKANPVIRSLMHSVKEEANDNIQSRAARGVARYIDLTIRLGKPISISEKVLTNLKGFLCADPTVGLSNPDLLPLTSGILSLRDPAGAADSAANEKATAAKKKGRPKAKVDASITSASKEIDAAAAATRDEEREKHTIESRGAAVAFQGICAQFGAEVFQTIPKMWAMIADDVARLAHPDSLPAALSDIQANADFAMSLAQSLHLLASIIPHVHKDLRSRIVTLLPGIAAALRAPLAIVRNMAARCLAVATRELTVPAMHVVVDHVLVLLNDAKNPHHRQGSAECVLHVVNAMDHDILPYIIFLIVPVLGRMSDPDEDVRFVSTNVFAQLVKLVPLESGVPDPEGFDQALVKQRQEERKFLGQLVGSEKVEEINLPVPIKAELRGYQKDGISWLAFLNRYGLHGILCDDMGLGKTLQSICMLATDHHNRAERFARTGSPDAQHVPSLIVCPPTLTGHWKHEIKTFAEFMKPIIYAGTMSERAAIRRQLADYDVVITSYEVLRNDIAELKDVRFNYCILDEGHMIKNPKTKLTQAVKNVTAMHRLILSGTPIQNNVLELWSLFDFLMPGFLGTERQFNERFSKPIQASRDAKSSSREQEKGALAMEALHKQVLPFLLRRMKEDVLHDLPPKIIQDYYCELSDLQKSLYEDFAKSQAKEGAEQILNGDDADDSAAGKKPKKSGHVFQALQYLRKLVNHPSLVINPSHPQYSKIQARLAVSKSGIKDLVHAPKIQALQQLLLDCGIGAEPTAGGSGAGGVTATAAPHRALIFVQLRPMLDIIEHDLLKKHMPSVSYLRMDGQTDPASRTDIVRKFNEDASIDVLLLTTHVGGLGLTLTGADTVIFVEHDWNPMKDLQAMDRAHRIGQKRVVNVYRLITKGTLEEKIMGLQKFKLNIASSVINQENSGLKSMDTDQILDLFSLGSSDQATATKKKDVNPHGHKPGASQILAELEELSDQTQYEDLNINEFLKGLK
ncbi:SNF2 family N-terminal domain-containing protein [Geranomyces variabilis]|nr:SNF2 family N-terminal domain-containing protein [Geranomyces variabilis]KAJ3139024.1 TATA-binding protein-associated factor mot1 [Geranomyces variabilis]